ncbi:MAG: SagB-type dehydrogenase domain-containing protein, partial [Cyanobacteria bacterium P01_H01_bin.130]
MYHQRTKYDPETLAGQGRSLNWEQQPSSYKHYAGGLTYDLRPYLSPSPPATAEVTSSGDPAFWARLSRLLRGVYGMTARVPQYNLMLRSAPSA